MQRAGPLHTPWPVQLLLSCHVGCWTHVSPSVLETSIHPCSSWRAEQASCFPAMGNNCRFHLPKAFSASLKAVLPGQQAEPVPVCQKQQNSPVCRTRCLCSRGGAAPPHLAVPTCRAIHSRVQLGVARVPHRAPQRVTDALWKTGDTVTAPANPQAQI